jgi:hypothetical protein
MQSQAELLKEKIQRLEPKHGTDDPYVTALKQQLSRLEKQVLQKETGVYQDNPVTLSVGTNGSKLSKK